MSTDDVLDQMWAACGAGIGANAQEMHAAVTAAMQVYHLRPYVSPYLRWQLLVPMSYPNGFDGALLLGLKVKLWDVPFPLVVLLPEGVDSL